MVTFIYLLPECAIMAEGDTVGELKDLTLHRACVVKPP